MEFTKSELHRRGDDMLRKGWTTRFYHDFVDSVWREPFINRTSGFDEAGGPDSVIAFDNNTRIFSISPVTNKFAFWQFIVRISFFKRYEPMELEIPDEEGLYLVYLFRDEEDKTHKRQKLFFTKNPTIEDIREVYLNRVIVAWVYWAYDLQQAIYFGDSRHGSEWPPQVHWSWHQMLNSLRESGIQIVNATYDGDGTQDAHFQFGITAGTLWHEDIHTSVEAVSDGEALPVWYFDLAGNPRFAVSPGKKFLNAGRVAFNSATGGFIQATNNYFVVYHLFATNCKLQPVISAMGQAEFETLGAATGTIEAEVATLRQTLPHSNLMHIGSFILQTSDGYTNSAKARLVWTSSNVDTFTTELDFDEITRILTLRQNNNKSDLEVEIPTSENTDEKVKIDGEDTTAGYLSEKIVAGTNITIQEGTGENENKLVITATGSGGTREYIVYSEAELIAAWNDARTDPTRAAIIYIGADITLTANRSFLITNPADEWIEFRAVANQKISIQSFEFAINRVVCRDLTFRTNTQTYVTVDGHYADFYNCLWAEEQYYSANFSAMKIAIKLKGTITNNTGKITIENPRHYSSVSYAINTGNIQPFIIQSTAGWSGTNQQMYIEIQRFDATLSFDRFSKVLLVSSAGSVPYKVTGDLTWYYHPDQLWPGTGNIHSSAELLKQGSVDDLRGDYIPESPIVKLLGVDADGKIRKADGEYGAGAITFENLDANGDVGTGADQVARGDHDHDIADLVLIFNNNLI